MGSVLVQFYPNLLISDGSLHCIDVFRDPVNGSHVPVPGLLEDIAIENENEGSGSEEVDPQPGPLLWPD